MSYDELKLVLDVFFGDPSRPVEETRDDLERLRDEIDMLLDALGG
ncbi:MAG TPA: hypothetical protein VIR54_07070 [Vicinamibacterales bacterium]|jgi:hypothetical protein